MTDDAKQQAWSRRCSKLEALGLDPYLPQLPATDPRCSQVQAILTEYKIATGQIVPVPPSWEGPPPLKPISTLLDLADWLDGQWCSTLATEMGGDPYKALALDQGWCALRNGFRLLAWLNVNERPEHSVPPETVAGAKTQIHDLERWVRQKIKDGWKPSPMTPTVKATKLSVKQGKRRDPIPSDEANILVRKFLEQNPKASARDVAKGVGIALGRVPELPAWRAEYGRRQATKAPLRKTPLSLTHENLRFIGKEDNMDAVDACIDAEDRVFRRLIEEADEQKRGELYALTKQQRKTLVETAVKQYPQRLIKNDAD